MILNSQEKTFMYKGRVRLTESDEFSEKFQTAFGPPPLIFGKLHCAFRDKIVTKVLLCCVVYYMILFPMKCM